MGAFTHGHRYAKTFFLHCQWNSTIISNKELRCCFYYYYCTATTTTSPPTSASPTLPGREVKGFFHPKLLQLSSCPVELPSTLDLHTRINAESALKKAEHSLRSLRLDRLGKSISIIHRFQSQVGQACDPSQTSFLVVETLKRCHLSNNVDVALEIFNSVPLTQGVPGEGYQLALRIVLDLLYRNDLYSTCTKIANDAVDRKHIYQLVRWFYAISIAAAYKMDSREGLNMAAKLFDNLAPLERAEGKTIPNHQMVLALYCIQQNELNAGLHILRQHDWKLNIREVNIRVLAYLQRGDIDLALSALRKFRRDSLAATQSDEEQHVRVLYHDVFKRLKAAVARSSQLDAIVYMDTVHKHFREMVSPWDLSSIVVNSLRKSYIQDPVSRDRPADHPESTRRQRKPPRNH